MVARINLPRRDVLNTVSHRDQRMIKWFEDTNEAVNDALAVGSGAGSFVLDDGTATSGGAFVMEDGGA